MGRVQLEIAAIAIQLPAARPLVPVGAAMVILDRDEDEILHAVENGALGWAWDIATPGAERRELRVWRDSIVTLATMAKPELLEAEEVMARIVPPGPIRSPQLQRLLSCSSTHVHSLIDAGVFDVEQGPGAPSGPQSYTLLRRSSVIRFLRGRRVC